MAKNNYFKMRDIRIVETICLKALDHKLDIYSPYHFLEFFIHIGFLFSSENVGKINSGIFDTFKNFAKDNKFVEYTSLEIAISCIVSNIDKQAADFFQIYDIKESDYKNCLDYLKG